MSEVLPGVHLIPIGGGDGDDGPTTNVYYVQGPQSGAFIDAGFPDEARAGVLLDYWRTVLGSPQTGVILLTHRHHEHAGGAKIVRDATGARVAAGRAEAAAIDAETGSGERIVGLLLDGDEVFDLGGGRRIRAVATPGHTAGTFCFLLEDQRALFTGDHIMGQGSVVVRTDQGGDMAEHIASMNKLVDMDLRIVLSGHGPAVHDVPGKVAELVRRRMEREEQVVALLHEGPNDEEGLLARLYADTPPRLLGLARHQVVAHLKKLEREGRAAADDRGAWRLR